MSGGVEGKLRDVLVRIRRAWPRQDEPRVTERSRQVPGPRVPLPAGWLTRDTVAGDLDYWADVAENNGVVPYRDGRDVVATAGHLLANVDALAAWEWADELTHDLARGARLLEELTSPPRPAVLLGPCPVEVVDEDGTRRPCGADVRAEGGAGFGCALPRLFDGGHGGGVGAADGCGVGAGDGGGAREEAPRGWGADHGDGCADAFDAWLATEPRRV